MNSGPVCLSVSLSVCLSELGIRLRTADDGQEMDGHSGGQILILIEAAVMKK